MVDIIHPPIVRAGRARLKEKDLYDMSCLFWEVFTSLLAAQLHQPCYWAHTEQLTTYVFIIARNLFNYNWKLYIYIFALEHTYLLRFILKKKSKM